MGTNRAEGPGAPYAGQMTVDLPMPRVGPVGEHAPKPLRMVLNWGRRYSLWVFNFAFCESQFERWIQPHDFTEGV